jgi:hypothetical protein
MHLPFEKLAPTSRIWVFQANRALAPHELTYLTGLLDTFCGQWTAHNQELAAGWEWKSPFWLVVGVDEAEAGASGCSIDKLMHLVTSLEQALSVDLRDRQLVAFELATSPEPVLVPLSQVRELVTLGHASTETATFDNLVTTKAAYDQLHKRPAGETWLARYFPKTPVVEI